jgi:hypothetical protein
MPSIWSSSLRVYRNITTNKTAIPTKPIQNQGFFKKLKKTGLLQLAGFTMLLIAGKKMLKKKAKTTNITSRRVLTSLNLPFIRRRMANNQVI